MTNILPPKQRAIFEHSGEVLECIPVREIAEQQFLLASRACEVDAAVVRFLH